MDPQDYRLDILEVLARLVSTDPSKIPFHCGEHASNKQQSVFRDVRDAWTFFRQL